MRPRSHYDYLDQHLPTFFKSLGIHWDSYRGIIVAHGDKCSSYRQGWEKGGLHHYHGVAIYLLSYVHPFSLEVRDTKEGWVDPWMWVLKNKDRFLPHLPPFEA